MPGKSELPFFGHLITDQGLKIDPAKVKAIAEMPSPTSKQELQTVLDMVTYLQRFAPKLSEITAPMRQLLSKDVDFSWDAPQENALQQVKSIITQSPGPILSYFDPNKEITLQVDSFKYGLSSVLIQEGKLVGFASIIDRSTKKSLKIKKKIISHLKIEVPTYTKGQLPKDLSSIKITTPGSRYIK